MPTYDAVFVGKIHLPEVGGGPIIPPGTPTPTPPDHIWGGPGSLPPFVMPPIYIPVPPPDGGGEPPTDAHPEHPIYIPVYPAHPIVLPLPPEPGEEPKPPYVWPPQIWGGPGGLPKPPQLPDHIWGPTDPRPEHPIYIPAPVPPGGEHPEHPIYLPVYPSHPIVLPPDGEAPTPPPGYLVPPTGARGVWCYSEYYGCMIFVPYAGIVGPGGGEQPPVSPPGR